MARYRKLDPRMWGDRKFRELSEPQPNAQTLWVYLLSGPHTCRLPGLSNVGRAELAEALGWPQEAFDKAFQELTDRGMVKADWKARVVFIPNALKYNAPNSTNALGGWHKDWLQIPECELRSEFVTVLDGVVGQLAPAFRIVFHDAWGTSSETATASGMPSETASATALDTASSIQEQRAGSRSREQEQGSREKTSPPEGKEAPSATEEAERRTPDVTAFSVSSIGPGHTGEYVAASKVLDHMTAKTGRKFRVSPGVTSMIRKVMEGGATLNDMYVVIDYKTEEWSSEEKMRRWLRPGTLFSEDHFDGYLHDAREWDGKGRPKIEWAIKKSSIGVHVNQRPKGYYDWLLEGPQEH